MRISFLPQFASRQGRTTAVRQVLRSSEPPRPTEAKAWWEEEEREAPSGSEWPEHVFSARGHSVALEPPLAEGGEGAIFPIAGDPHRAVKIYHPHLRQHTGQVERMRAKVSAMVGFEPLASHSRFAWPRLEVFDGSGAWLGFAMVRLPGRSLHGFGAPRAFLESFPGWDRRHMARVALSLAKGLRFLHAHGVLMGDINPGNVLVDPEQACVSFIDCDSYQMRIAGIDYPCEGMVDSFTPPELQAGAGRLMRGIEQENFSAAVLLFHVLMLGLHPYSHKGGDSPARNLLAGICPLGRHRSCQLPSGPWLRMWSNLPQPVQALFERTFVQGHRDPLRRASLDQWCAVIGDYARSLEAGACPTEPLPASIDERQKSF